MSRSNSTQKQKDRHIRQIHKHHHGKIVLENRLADVHDVDPIVRQHIAHLLNDDAFVKSPWNYSGSTI